jgi:hypothetical protein
MTRAMIRVLLRSLRMEGNGVLSVRLGLAASGWDTEHLARLPAAIMDGETEQVVQAGNPSGGILLWTINETALRRRL